MLISCRNIAQISFKLGISKIFIVLADERCPRLFKLDKSAYDFSKQASMRIGKVSDIVNILSINDNFKVTLNTTVLTLMPLK